MQSSPLAALKINMQEIILFIISHTAALLAGIVIDRFILQRIHFTNAEKVRVDINDIVRVGVLLTVFVTAMASVIHIQFFGGGEMSWVLSIGGFYSFGSLIGEGEFFRQLISKRIDK